MPPKVTDSDGLTKRPSATQKWLWDNWLDYWRRTRALKKKLGARVIAIINGDWGDMNTHSNFQLVEPADPDTVLNMMLEVALPAKIVSDALYVVRGTEAHTGGVGWMENHAAAELGAERNEQEGTHSWYYLELEAEGVKIASAHHPGTNSMRPWTTGNEANRRAAMDTYNYFGQDWVPDLTLWGHYHHDADSHDTHPIRAIYNRCWQVKTAFVHRLGMGG